MDTDYIRSHIRNIPDFPEKGIQFKDITPLLLDAKANELTLSALLEPYKTLSVDKIVGLESRGFLFGPSLAKDSEQALCPQEKRVNCLIQPHKKNMAQNMVRMFLKCISMQ